MQGQTGVKSYWLSDKNRCYLEEAAAVIIGMLIAIAPPLQGLTREAMVFLGILCWAIINWFFNTMPIYASGLIMLALFALTGITPFQVAFGQFATNVVWLVLSVILIGTAVSKSGLLSRICLTVMKICPPTFKGQVFAMLGGGCLLGPMLPSTSAKVVVAGPFTTRIGELLGFSKRSKGMNGMFLAMETGFYLLAPMFITCSFWSYMILDALTPQDAAMFTFLGWFKVMLPWSLIMVPCSYLAITFLYKPEEEVTIDRSGIQAMLDELGALKYEEKVTIAVLIVCLVCWVLERTIHVAAVIPAVLAVGVLTFLKVLTPKDLNSANWSFVIFTGCCTGISTEVSAVGLDTWLAERMGSLIATFAANPYLFILSVAIATLLIRFLLVGASAVIVLFMALLAPICQAAQINLWVVGIIVYVMGQPWFLKYENPSFMGGFESAGGDEYLDFNGTVKYCVVYNILALIGLFVCVPFWRLWGLLP